MKKKQLTIIITSTIAAAVATGVIIYLVKRKQAEKRTIRVAEEGYETAEDILYPPGRRRWSFQR